MIGQTALETLSTGRARRLTKLTKEVADGRSIVVSTEDGDIFRLVSLVVLRIRHPDGSIFSQLGKWDSTQAKLVDVGCQLPGAKQLREELSSETVERIFKSKLSPLAEKVEFVSSTREVSEKESKLHGVQTKYLRTICEGWLLLGQELSLRALPMLTSPWGSDSSHDAKLSWVLGREVFAIWDECVATFYSWLDPQDFELLSGMAGEDTIRAWLSSLSPLEYIATVIV